MKTSFIKSLLAIFLTFFALPMLGQDYMEVYFKDGMKKKFQLSSIVEISTKKNDVNGISSGNIMYQHIRTKSNNYVYNLASIDSITFCKLSEEESEKALDDALNSLFPILDQAMSIKEAERQLEQIKNATGVNNAWSDGKRIYVSVNNGPVMTFDFHDEEDDSDEDVLSDQSMSELNTFLSRAVENLNGAKPKVAIVNQTIHDKKQSFVNAEKRFSQLENYFNKFGIKPERVAPTIDFFYSGIFNYNIVLLCTHGGVRLLDKYNYETDKDGDLIHTYCTMNLLGSRSVFKSQESVKSGCQAVLNSLFENKPYQEALYDAETPIYLEWHCIWDGTKPYWHCYAALSENFFKYYSEGNFPNNSVLFAAVCSSLNGSSSLAGKLGEKNLGCYLGFDQEVRASVSSKAAQQFFTNILAGKAFQKSFNELPKDLRYDWMKGSNLDIKYYSSSKFAFPTVTSPISQTQAMSDYSSSQTVEVQGYAFSYDPKAILYGFNYGTDKSFSVCKNAKDVEVVAIQNALDDQNCNIKFEGKLTDIKPNTTYYYRAYTSDGTYFNYGNPESFRIEGPAPTPAGSGEAIDLGLPSGTLWANKNIGASKQEDYGDYFAWGETAPQSDKLYNWAAYKWCNDDPYSLTKYCNVYSFGPIDGKKVLEAEDDAATANWGDDWCMPTKKQFEELLSYTVYERTTLNGVNGQKFTSKINGNYIFLPSAGERMFSSSNMIGKTGYYWSSTLSTSMEYQDNAIILLCGGGGVSTSGAPRAYGLPVRPVRRK